MNFDFSQEVVTKTNEELLDIYKNPDNYQESFVQAVVEELEERKVNIESFRIEKENNQRIAQKNYESGREGNEAFIIIGFIFAFLGGFIGIIAGYTYSQSKHSDPTGKRYYVYNKKTREKGKIMLFMGLFVFLGTLAWKFTG